jgi:hypothetical protein
VNRRLRARAPHEGDDAKAAIRRDVQELLPICFRFDMAAFGEQPAAFATGGAQTESDARDGGGFARRRTHDGLQIVDERFEGTGTFACAVKHFVDIGCRGSWALTFPGPRWAAAASHNAKKKQYSLEDKYCCCQVYFA